ncbi:DUF3883 domain-containing protein [Acidilobus sp.]|uniref:DUF3883 domain-containing protein n=1 Tax=Acidilobus sp. TaxID=1872109 RepID=UPI003D071C8F
MAVDLTYCQSQSYAPVCDVMKEWLSQASPSQRTGVYDTAKNAVGIIYKNIFMSSDQFVLEFLQNAEDARFELCQAKPELCKDKGVFRIYVFNDRIVIENNGKSIDRDDIRSLCYIRQRKRPSAGYKGFIGIGWKSVFKVSARVDVASRRHDSDDAVAFSFSRDAWYNDPSLKGLLSKLNVKPEDVVWELTPIPVQPPSDLERGWTRFTVYVDRGTAGELSKAIYEKLRGHMFLFLRYINRVEIYDYVANRQRVIEWSLEGDPEKFNDITVYKYRTLEVEKPLVGDVGQPQKYEGRFLVFSREVSVPDCVKQDRETRNANREDVKTREVSIAFELDPVKDEIKRPRGSQLLGVYSFLPLDEVESGLRFLIQADFILQAGRRTINFEAEWNKWIMGEIGKLLEDSLPYLMDHYKGSYLAVLDYSENVRPEMRNLLKNSSYCGGSSTTSVWDVIDKYTNQPSKLVVLDWQGVTRTLDEVFKPEDDSIDNIIYDLLAQNLIDEDDLSYIFNGRRLYPLSKDQKLSNKIKITKCKAEDLLNKQLIGNMLKKDRLRTYKLLVKLYYYLLVKLYKELLDKNRLNPSIIPSIIILPDIDGNVEGPGPLYYVNEPLSQGLSRFRDIILGYRRQISQLSGEKFLDDEFIKVAVEVLGEQEAQKLLTRLEDLGAIKKKDLKGFAWLLLQKLLIVSDDPSLAGKQKSSIVKEHLPALTAFAFAYYPSLGGDKGIWMLSEGGELEQSTNLYAHDVLRLLGGSNEAKSDLMKLGIKFVDDRPYLDALNGNEGELTSLLRAAKVRGPRLCEDKDTAKDLINKLVEAAVSSLGAGGTNNVMDYVKYMKYLKDLYEGCKAAGGATAIEDVMKSPEVRSRISQTLGKFGEEYVKRRLKELAESPQTNKITIGNVTFEVKEVKGVSSQDSGYDILLTVSKVSTDENKKEESEDYYIEVKTISKESETPPLTDNERRFLIDHMDKYLVAVVKGAPSNPEAFIVSARALLEERWEKALTEETIKRSIKENNEAIVKNVIYISQEMIDRLRNKNKVLKI